MNTGKRPLDSKKLDAEFKLSEKAPFTLPDKNTSSTEWITIRTSAPDSSLPPSGQRITPAYASVLPKVVSPGLGEPALRTAPRAHHYRFLGVEFVPVNSEAHIFDLILLGDNGPDQDSYDEVPHHIILDRCYVHAYPTQNLKRGIQLNSAHTDIFDSYIEDFKVIGQEAQAIAGFNGPGPFKIINNYLEGAGENILFGGATPSLPDLIPSDIEIRRNHLGADSPGGVLHVEVDGADVTGPLSIPNTGNWTIWGSAIKTGVTLTAGQHVLRVFFDDSFFASFQSIRIADAAQTPVPFSGTAIGLPGVVPASDFDEGGEMVGYHDNTAGCTGDCWFRTSDVDLWTPIPPAARTRARSTRWGSSRLQERRAPPGPAEPGCGRAVTILRLFAATRRFGICEALRRLTHGFLCRDRVFSVATRRFRGSARAILSRLNVSPPAANALASRRKAF